MSAQSMSVKMDQLKELIVTLRGENGCPWDRKQNPLSMGIYLVEEVYELVEAIESGDVDDIEEELGDVLFQLLFLARLYEEQGHFDTESAAEKNIEKMIRRHPHVFGEPSAITTDQVRQQWREIKQTEKNRPFNRSVLDGIPGKLPALMRAYRVSERAAGAGFDWDDIDGVVAKVEEEWAEFKEELAACKKKDAHTGQALALEFGDIFFTLVNVGRFLRVHPETALSASTRKFETRFRKMEEMLAKGNQTPISVPRPVLDDLWEMVKKETD
jgi:tetrapyrrole methylase family protein/MazG family protein